MTEDQITATLKREGWPKYTDDPADHGGPTKGGVTLKDLEEFRGKSCTAEDVKALDESEVRGFYHWKYDRNYSWCGDAWLQALMLDTEILQGPKDAIKMVQTAVGVKADGWVGPKTRAAITVFDVTANRLLFVEARIHLLLDDMVARLSDELIQTSNLKYRHGWVNRSFGFLKES